MSHPLRARILRLLEGEVRSPQSLAGELSEPVGKVSHHVRKLVTLGVIELVDSRPRRGAIEHLYRARFRIRVEVGAID